MTTENTKNEFGSFMITAILKLLFDLCFYYTLSGYFISLVTKNFPLIWGIPLIIAVNIIYFTVSKLRSGVDASGDNHRNRPLSIACSILPAAFFLFQPAVWQIVQFVPAWVYSCFIIWTGRIVVEYREFESHFSFTGKFFFLMFLGIAFIKNLPDALSGAIPYFALYVLTGVCLMRILRAEGKLSALRNAAVLLALLLGAVAITVFRAPQLFATVFGFIYNNVIVWMLTGLAMLIAGIGYGFYYLFHALISLFAREPKEPNLNFSEMAQDILGEEVVATQGAPLVWLKIVLLTLLGLAILLTVFLIFRRLLGRKSSAKIDSAYTIEQERLERKNNAKTSGMFRPKEPRLAVRWYYRKYLKEGISRGALLLPPDTSEHVQSKYEHFFTAAGSDKLREVYIKSRYAQLYTVESGDVTEAQELWKSLKGEK